MNRVKHFVDSNTLTKNYGYKNIEEQLNEFFESDYFKDKKLISLQYSSDFNSNDSDIHGSKGVLQYTALVYYRKKRFYE